MFNDGKMIIINPIMPRPPIQWVRLLQNRMLYGSASISFRTEDPVVVKPEQDSKQASVKEGMEPLNRKGKVPNRITINHESVTERNPSLFVIFTIFTLPVRKYSPPDNIKVTAEDQRNGNRGSLNINATGKHESNEIVSINRITLNILSITKGLINFI